MDTITQTVDFWKAKGLSIRASYVLAKADISEAQLATYQNADALTDIKNCGAQTAQEIWDFITKPKTGSTGMPKVKEVSFDDLIPE
jgi:hypothetical protein